MLVVTIPEVMSFSNEMELLDMKPGGYDYTYVKSLLDTLGVEGRDKYLKKQIPVDMVYPLLFAISYCLIIVYFLKRLGKHQSALFYLCLLPVIGGIFDYLENIGIITLLNSYPDISETQVTLTSTFSLVKSISMKN